MAGETILVVDDSPTILKVVQLVLTKAGYDVVTASDGDEGLELAREVRPDLILIDFVMPRMNGYQVCRAMQEDEALREIPALLMSAKGDQVGERFVKATGTLDYITKPFSPEAIIGLVQHTLAKARGAASTPAAESDPAPEDPRRAALARLAEVVSRAAGPRVAGAAAERGVELDPAEVAAWIAGAVGEESLGELLDEIVPQAGALAEGEGVALAGDLARVPLADVLQLLQQERQSGALEVTHGRTRAVLHFRQGLLDLAVASGVDDAVHLGSFLVSDAGMSLEEIRRDAEAQASGEAGGSPLGDDDLRELLRRQACELVYELLRWSGGAFALRAGEPPPEAVAAVALGLEMDTVLMEGIRRIDEWHLIERQVDDFEAVFVRNEDAVVRLGRGRLTRDEIAVLELVNGRNTVKDIVRQSKMGGFDVGKMLYRLLSVKLIRRRVPPMAA